MIGEDQIASLTYLLLLGVVLGGYFFVSQRQNLGRMMQHAALWLFIFLGAIVAVGLWMEIRRDMQPMQVNTAQGTAVEVPMAPDGHFYLTLAVNGTPVRFVVDTGATEIVLRMEDAMRAGIDTGLLMFTGRAMTANGPVQIAPVRLDTLSLGVLTDRDVRAVVNEGEMGESLLGMSYLRRFGRIEIADGVLTLER